MCLGECSGGECVRVCSLARTRTTHLHSLLSACSFVEYCAERTAAYLRLSHRCACGSVPVSMCLTVLLALQQTRPSSLQPVRNGPLNRAASSELLPKCIKDQFIPLVNGSYEFALIPMQLYEYLLHLLLNLTGVFPLF